MFSPCILNFLDVIISFIKAVSKTHVGSFSREMQIENTLLTITYIAYIQMFVFSIVNIVKRPAFGKHENMPPHVEADEDIR